MGILNVIRRPVEEPAPTKILAIDIGGTKVKALVRGHTKPRKMPSGKSLTPERMVERVRMLAKGWDYEAVSIGYPGLVGSNGPRSEPGNLGRGWVGFDYAAAFGVPVRILNDAAMQALGSYEGGRMLFLGLGTGVGSTLISENVIIPMELGQLRHNSGEMYSEILGRKGLNKIGKLKWREILTEFVATLNGAFVVDYIVIGGGNAKKVKELPPGARQGHNLTAFRGGFRLWTFESITTHEPEGNNKPAAPAAPAEWRVI